MSANTTPRQLAWWKLFFAVSAAVAFSSGNLPARGNSSFSGTGWYKGSEKITDINSTLNHQPNTIAPGGDTVDANTILSGTLNIDYTNSGAGNTTLASGSLTKVGAGTMTLSGWNTHIGSTTINSGTLQIGSGSTLRATANGTLGSYTGGATINGAVLHFGNGGTLGSTTGSGLTINGGTLANINSGNSSYNLIHINGTIINNGTISGAALQGTVALTGNTTLGGTSNISKSGTGQFVYVGAPLSGTGAVTLNKGVLLLLYLVIDTI
jgi:autotransporter-associated beta strand protein